ncbi:MAG: DEAD/DEAH box helicase, partial [Candidatus Atribacteria bacterium]
MSLNPIKTTQEIREQYTRYLKSLFFLKDKDLMKQAEELLDEPGKFVRGPYVEITPPFVLGSSIRDLINESILSKDFTRLASHLPIDRPLYAHQEKAIRKTTQDDCNIVVATGTGSGKTECFLIPIINYLMRQKENGQLGPGVRALLLYPMNAFANDQLSRLRTILSDYPDITFGRYTGETEEKDEVAEEVFHKIHPNQKRLKNEIMSREAMRKAPPNLLLTNYAMLEYLLLRPDDNVFFDGEYSDQWHFLVLDEAHTYNGAKGTEIAMLIRRLKERIGSGASQKLQSIATSATLGGGQDAYAEVADFAQSIFSEQFTKDDVIESERIQLNTGTGKPIRRLSQDYNALTQLLDTHKHQELYHELKNDENLHLLQSVLTGEPKLLKEVAGMLFCNEPLSLESRERAVVNLVNLSSAAKADEESMPLLPARYHVFVKSMEGAYIQLFPQRKLYVDRHESIKLQPGQEVPVFEMANCQRCGQEYLVGTTKNEVLCHVQTNLEVEGLQTDRMEYYMLEHSDSQGEFDEDDLIAEQQSTVVPDTEEYVLCTGCGHIERAGALQTVQCCPHPDEKYISIWKLQNRKSRVNTCYGCGTQGVELIKRFLTADDPATEVLAKCLYQNVPVQINSFEETSTDDSDFFSVSSNANPQSDSELGRKLLIFSDSRQDAAFFATYMNRKYRQLLWRNGIL